MTRENILDKCPLYIGMASESCFKNLRLSRDSQESLFDQFRATHDSPAREQIMLQIYKIIHQEASQMQKFMLDIGRSMSKACQDLVANFISSLTNLVCTMQDPYLCHAHPNLNAIRLRNLHAAPISDLFDRAFVQQYEKHLFGMEVKPGSKKE